MTIDTPWGTVAHSTQPLPVLVKHPTSGQPVQPQATLWMHAHSHYIVLHLLKVDDGVSTVELAQPQGDKARELCAWLVAKGHLPAWVLESGQCETPVKAVLQ